MVYLGFTRPALRNLKVRLMIASGRTLTCPALWVSLNLEKIELYKARILKKRAKES